MFWPQYGKVRCGTQLSQQIGREVHNQAQKLLQVNLQTLSFLWQRLQPVTATLKWPAFEEEVNGRETDKKAVRELVQAVRALHSLETMTTNDGPDLSNKS